MNFKSLGHTDNIKKTKATSKVNEAICILVDWVVFYSMVSKNVCKLFSLDFLTLLMVLVFCRKPTGCGKGVIWDIIC